MVVFVGLVLERAWSGCQELGFGDLEWSGVGVVQAGYNRPFVRGNILIIIYIFDIMVGIKGIDEDDDDDD